MVGLGMRFGGKIVLLPWSKLGHLLIVGMTGSGKSSMLRVIVLQAIRNGFLLLLADIDQTTFAMLERHENLMAPIATTAQDAAVRLEQRLRQEARADFETAVAEVENWQQADRAAKALAEAARLAALAYSLGEGGLDQVLIGRRLALEGELMTQQAQLSALSALARLKLDSHQLWPLDVDADGVHAHP